jgi:hypothetical protein
MDLSAFIRAHLRPDWIFSQLLRAGTVVMHPCRAAVSISADSWLLTPGSSALPLVPLWTGSGFPKPTETTEGSR